MCTLDIFNLKAILSLSIFDFPCVIDITTKIVKARNLVIEKNLQSLKRWKSLTRYLCCLKLNEVKV